MTVFPVSRIFDGSCATALFKLTVTDYWVHDISLWTKVAIVFLPYTQLKTATSFPGLWQEEFFSFFFL